MPPVRFCFKNCHFLSADAPAKTQFPCWLLRVFLLARHRFCDRVQVKIRKFSVPHAFPSTTVWHSRLNYDDAVCQAGVMTVPPLPRLKEAYWLFSLQSHPRHFRTLSLFCMDHTMLRGFTSSHRGSDFVTMTKVC